MIGETDGKDKNESRRMAVALVVLVTVLLVGARLSLSVLEEIAATHLSPGLGLKSAAVISFVVSVVLMIVFAVASGDGLLGELPYVLGGFFLFFLIVWLLTAWIF